jgi:hypothetical protein
MSNIKIDRWICTECGINHGKNDIWFEGDICGDCKHQELNLKMKDEIESKLIKLFVKMGISIPNNLETITQSCFEYLIIDENYTPLSDFDSQMLFAVKHWIEEQV